MTKPTKEENKNLKCYYCGKDTDKVYRPDIDVQGLPMCDDVKCIVELYLFLTGENAETTSTEA